MSAIVENDMVTISYIGKLDNGEVFKTVEPDNPLIVQIGNSEAPPTLDIALKGKKVGDVLAVRVPPDESYGPRLKDLVQTLAKKSFGDKINPKAGMTVSLKVEKDGQPHDVPATIIELKGDQVVVDYNHPLAGHHLNYDITIHLIEKP